MIRSILNEIASPLSRRIGTATAAALAAYNIADPQLSQIQIGVSAICMVAFDLLGSYLARKERR